MFVFKAAVVGGGEHGGEIAQVIAMADLPVVLADVEEEGTQAGLERARELTRAQLDAAVARGRLPAESAERHLAAISARIAGASGYDAFGDVDFVIDAGRGERRRRRAIFADLDETTPGHAILALGTPGTSVTQVAGATSRPDKVVGFRLFPPAAATRLVEVVAGEESSPQSVQVATTFAQALRRTPVRCEDAPGWIVDRVLAAAVTEAWRHAEATRAEPEAIDAALLDAGVVSAGPLRSADPSALAELVATAHGLHDAYGVRFQVPAGLEARARGAVPGGPSERNGR